MNRRRHDGPLIVGGGLAGLSAALEAARAGAKGLVVTPDTLLNACASAWAQGGIAAALGGGDSAADHAADTAAAGAGLVEADAARALTEAGRETAWDVIRRERLWERFLVDQLKLDPARAIGWACQLEHATAPEVIEALDGFLQYPATCPQGQPIPRSADDAVHGEGRMLSEAEIGERVRLTAFDDEDPEVLTYLQRQGLAIGQVVSVVEMGPRRSPLTLRLENGQAVIGRDLALTIQTERVA